MASALLIFITALLFTTVVAVFLSLAAGSSWRLVRELLLVVAVVAGVYVLGFAAMVAPEWRVALIAAAGMFLLASAGMRIAAYRPSRRCPDRPRGVLWRRGALVGLPVVCLLWLGMALFIEWRLRAEIEAGIEAATRALEATPVPAGARDLAPVYDAIASRLREDEEAPEAAQEVLADDGGFSSRSPDGTSVTLSPSLLSDLDGLERDEAEDFLEDVSSLFRRHEQDLATLRRAAVDPEGHLANSDVAPYWEQVGAATRLRAVWACRMALYRHAEQAKREGDLKAVLASASALDGLADQLVRTAPLGFREFRGRAEITPHFFTRIHAIFGRSSIAKSSK